MSGVRKRVSGFSEVARRSSSNPVTLSSVLFASFSLTWAKETIRAAFDKSIHTDLESAKISSCTGFILIREMMSQQLNILSGMASQNHSPRKLHDIVNKCFPVICSLLGPIGKLDSDLGSLFSSVDISYFAPKRDLFFFSR